MILKVKKIYIDWSDHLMGINTLYGITSIAVNASCDFARNPFAELKSVFALSQSPG